MLIEAVVLSVIAGLLFKGRFTELRSLEIRQDWLLFGGLIVRYLPRLLDLKFMSFIPYSSAQVSPVFFILSYAMMTLGIAFNLRYIEMYPVLAGVLMNCIVVAVNGGYMPVSREILTASGFPVSGLINDIIDANHKLTGADTRMRILADIIPLIRYYPVRKIISIGDILMSAGVFVFIFRSMRGMNKPRRKSNREEY